MFYTQLFTSKRGPLAKIWLAAHWEKKLTKANVFECNLETTIRDILSPKMKIGLRTSGHLLLGVVKIYSRKANYLLKDCNNALVKAKLAFRPGQTDLPEEGLEATIKAITLVEGFNTFDDQLPLSNSDIAEHFSLNQSRLEEITMKEQFETTLLTVNDFEEPQGCTNNLLDISFHSFTQHGDQFGDEDRELDLLDFLTNSSDHPALTDFISEEPQSVNMEHDAQNDQQEEEDSMRCPETESRQRVVMETPTSHQMTLLANEEEAFALEPVTVTPISERKRGKRRRKLVVDNVKELSNDFIAQQLNDYSDLVAPLELAPPTAELMHWKENGGADKLFSQPCSFLVSPQIKEFFSHRVFQMKSHSVCEEVEEMRQEEQEVPRNASSFFTNISEVSSVSPEKSHMTEPTLLDYTDGHCLDSAQFDQDESSSDGSLPAPPSEDSLFVHPSTMNQDTHSTSLHTQSLLSGEDFEERRATRQAQRLLTTLKQTRSGGDPSFSLTALCRGRVRSVAAKTFFCFLLLKKGQALELHQSAPYEDVLATPGPAFYE